MLFNQILVSAIGYDDEIFNRHKWQKSLKGRPDERFACAEYIQKLFRLCLAAYGPKASTHATCHNDTISVTFHTLIKKESLRIIQR
jgi:hypothetical protein